MNIRAMTKLDVPRVAELEKQSFTDPWAKASFAEMLDQPRTVLLAAEEDGAVIGYAIGTSVADEGEVLNVAVDGAQRRRGIGRQLIERLIVELERRGALQMFLEVRASNLAAISLYEGHGFTAMGRRKGYYRAPKEDAVTMVRRTGVNPAKK